MADNKIEFLIEGKDKFTSTFASFGKSIASLGSLVAGFAAGALAHATTQALEFASSIKETADKVGFSTDALQEWRSVAQLSGASAEKMDAALGMFSRTMGQAAAGSHEAQKALERVGITLNDLNNLTPEQVFEKTRDSISGMGSASQRNATLMQIFGRQGKDLGNVFSETSTEVERMRMEVGKLGGVMDRETIAKAKETKDKLDAMTNVIKVQLSTALVAVGPLLVKTAELIANIATKAVEAGKAFGYFLGLNPTTDPYDKLLEKFTSLSDEIARVKATGGLPNAMGPVDKYLENLKANLADVQAQLEKMRGAGKEKGPEKAAAKTPLDKDYLDALRKQVDASSGIKMQALIDERDAQRKKLAEMNADYASNAKANELIDQDFNNKRRQIESETYAQLGASSDLFYEERQRKLELELANMRSLKMAETEIHRYAAAQELQIEADKITQRQQQRVTDLNNQIIISQSTGQVLDLSLQQWSASLQTWQSTLSQTVGSTMTTMVDGISTAIGRAIVLGESMSEALKSVMQNVAISVISALAKIGVQMLATWLISKFVTVKQASTELARGLAAVYVNSFASAAAIPFYGWAIAPNAAAVNLALAYSGAATAAATGAGMGTMIAGAAHGGMTDVPNEGTFLLNKGERVLSPQQNNDLTDFLATGGNASTISVNQLVINIEVPDSKALIGMDRNDWRDIVARNVIPALDALDRMGVRQVALERQRGI